MIKQVGAVQPMDEDGFIINMACHNKVMPHWMNLIEALISELKNAVIDLQAIYVRGSVAVGRAIDGVSDLDLIVLAFSEYERNQEACENVKYSHFEGADFCKKVDISFCTDRMLLSPSDTNRFFIKTQSLFMHGNDISHAIPAFRIDSNLVSHLWVNDQGVLDMFTKHIANDDVELNVADWCTWLMKMIIRNAFLSVMIKAQCFTRDLWPCFKIFSQYQPSSASDALYDALCLAVTPTDDPEQVVIVAKTAMSLIYETVSH